MCDETAEGYKPEPAEPYDAEAVALAFNHALTDTSTGNRRAGLGFYATSGESAFESAQRAWLQEAGRLAAGEPLQNA